MEQLQQVGTALSTLPQDFAPHKQIRRVLDQRKRMLEGEEDVDWATAEALAFGTLVLEGNHVRVSGQDSERGTFSQRHAVVHDQNTGRRYKPLGFVYKGQPYDQFMVSNSSLSEYGVLGFEQGFSTESPNSLVCWEAQFGDFCNGSQVIIDQFIASGEAKWLRQSGLTLLLPHGYDGQGPEHSSARLERFLQLSDEDPSTVPEMDRSQRRQIQNTNLQICNATTPANYFHLLRRQVHRDFRKPLVIMTPKNLLRHPQCRSPLNEFDDKEDEMQGVRFRRLIMDKTASDRNVEPEPVEPNVRRLVLCQGKVYYELDKEREQNELSDDVKICRVEQMAPFPFDLVMRELKRYPNAEIVWCQEEPHNMGAWFFVAPRIDTCLRRLDRSGEVGAVKYVGRPPSASPATGFHDQHAAEQEALVKGAVHLD
jgi:2-oxoglutarate dehydrogenase E1 component